MLDCFTDRPEVYNFAPICSLEEYAPEVFKAPATPADGTLKTAKFCPALRELYKVGIAVPAWSDVKITIGKKGTDSWEYQFADEQSVIHYHSPLQLGNKKGLEDWIQLKFISSWLFKCKEDVRFLATEEQFAGKAFGCFSAAQGILNYKHQHASNINLFFQRGEEEYSIVIPHLFPLQQIVPLTEKRIEIRNHLVGEEEYKKLVIRNHSFSFSGSYYKKKNLLRGKEYTY